MFALIASAIARIRKKSLAERRVLGVAAFVSSSFVVIALWIVSMGSLLGNAPPAELGNTAEKTEFLPRASEAGEKIESSAAAELMTPFQSLKVWLGKASDKAKQTLTEALALEQEAARQIEETVETAGPSMASSAPQATGEIAKQQTPVQENSSVETNMNPVGNGVPNRVTAETKKAAAKTTKPSPPLTPEAPMLGKALAIVSVTDPAASQSAARLASPPATTAVESQTPKFGFYSEVTAIAKYNLAEMRRAASDIYQYLSK